MARNGLRAPTRPSPLDLAVADAYRAYQVALADGDPHEIEATRVAWTRARVAQQRAFTDTLKGGRRR